MRMLLRVASGMLLHLAFRMLPSSGMGRLLRVIGRMVLDLVVVLLHVVALGVHAALLRVLSPVIFIPVLLFSSLVFMFG